MMKPTGKTDASSGGVQLARDSRPGVRRMIASGGEAFHEGGLNPRPHPIIQSIPNAFLKRIHPMPGVLTAPVLALQFRLNQDRILKEIDSLMDAKANTTDGKRLDLLANLAVAWEEQHYPISQAISPRLRQKHSAAK